MQNGFRCSEKGEPGERGEKGEKGDADRVSYPPLICILALFILIQTNVHFRFRLV